MNIQGVIDRFEGSKAVLLLGDDEVQVIWPRNILPSEVKEGDILQINLEVDYEATESAKEEAKRLLEQVIAKNQDG